MTMGELGAFLYEQPLLALTIMAIMVAVCAGMISTSFPRLGHALSKTGYLGLTGALLLTVAQLVRYNSQSEAALWLDRTPPVHIFGSETIIPMRADGHFWVDAQINGETAGFMIDTGATYTAVSHFTAQKAGLQAIPGNSAITLTTANGTLEAEMSMARTLSFGSIHAQDLSVLIGINSDENTNVIGMNLLSQLAAWRVENNRLILTPKDLPVSDVKATID